MYLSTGKYKYRCTGPNPATMQYLMCEVLHHLTHQIPHCSCISILILFFNNKFIGKCRFAKMQYFIGGVREAFFSDEHYDLLWGRRMGFAKIAIEAKVVSTYMYSEFCYSCVC